MEFNERLANLLNEKKMSQREFASKININEAAMSKYVNGSRKPRMDILVNIARELNVSVEFLTGNEEESDFDDIKNLVCRNVSSMTESQKMELIEIISRKVNKWD